MTLFKIKVNLCVIFFLIIFSSKSPCQIQHHAILKSAFIFDQDDRPTPECHASTIVYTESGPVAAWFGGTYEKHKDVGIWISRWENGKWTKPVEAANGIISGTERFPCWNPVLFRPENGTLMLFYKVGPDPVNWWGMVKVSNDNGKTWWKSKKLPNGIIGPVKNKPVQLKNGIIISPSSSENNGWNIHFEISADMGKTWTKTENVVDEKNIQAIQPAILIHPGGKLQALCRSRKNCIAQSWSYDSGKTWSKLTGTTIPNPNSGIDAVTLRDGRHFLVYNPTTVMEGKWGGPRSPLSVAVSKDGIKWSKILDLENNSGEYSYPAVIQDPNGLVHITYTYKRESVKYVVVDPGKIKY